MNQANNKLVLCTVYKLIFKYFCLPCIQYIFFLLILLTLCKHSFFSTFDENRKVTDILTLFNS